MTITINGQQREFADGLTGSDLLAELRIPASTMVAELNGRIVVSAEFVGLKLADGDVLELVTLVGGG